MTSQQSRFFLFTVLTCLALVATISAVVWHLCGVLQRRRVAELRHRRLVVSHQDLAHALKKGERAYLVNFGYQEEIWVASGEVDLDVDERVMRNAVVVAPELSVDEILAAARLQRADVQTIRWRK